MQKKMHLKNISHEESSYIGQIITNFADFQKNNLFTGKKWGL